MLLSLRYFDSCFNLAVRAFVIHSGTVKTQSASIVLGEAIRTGTSPLRSSAFLSTQNESQYISAIGMNNESELRHDLNLNYGFADFHVETIRYLPYSSFCQKYLSYFDNLPSP